MKRKKIFTILLVLSIIFLDICINKAYAIDEEKYTNYTELKEVSCGGLVNIPSFLPKTVSILYTLIQIIIPVVLVVMGIMDLVKGLTSQKEDDIKKAQGMFVKRLISAALVFFVITAVKVVISFSTNENHVDSKSLLDCMNCIINNKGCNSKLEAEGNWECTYGTYTFMMNMSGKPYLEIDRSKTYIREETSEFKPSIKGECPTSDKYDVQLKSYSMYEYDFVIEKKN